MKKFFTLFAILTLVLTSCTSYTDYFDLPQEKKNQNVAKVKMTNDNTCYRVSMTVNGVEIKNVIVDTGCTITSLSYNDFVYMKENGIISDDDFIKEVTNHNSDGSFYKKHVYRIKEIRVGNAIINDTYCVFDLNNQRNNIRLLGLNVLSNFNVSFDFLNNVMILRERSIF